MLILIIVLVCVILALMIYNMSIHKKIQTFHNMNQRITNLNILQDFMNIIGRSWDVDRKIQAINEVIIEKYEIKYSTNKNFRKCKTKYRYFSKNYTLKGLTKSKKYYIKVRAYNEIGGTYYKGKWSAVKVVKVKK